jgi:hypothetical protein
VSSCSLCYDSDDASFYEYFRKIKAIESQENADKYYGFLKSGAFYCLFFEKVAFVMKRPTIVSQNERKQLHSITGPALAFSDGTEIYKLDGVTFDKRWWTKIVKGKLKASEVFAIDNLEHRRIAYEYMDKSKMKEFKDYKVLDEQIDEKGNTMKIVSFTVQKMDEPLKFYNCICPSTGREYFIGTDKNTCAEAKSGSFGLEDVEFVEEW